MKYRCIVTFTPRDLPGVLDMLRYDQSRVETWDHAAPRGEGRSGETFRVTLTSERPPTLARWQSFGLYPTIP